MTVPELPDVEQFRGFFEYHATGRTVGGLWVDPTILRAGTPRSLDRAMRGRRFERPTRHGKWMIAWTDGPALAVHFGMTGDLIWSGDEPERHRHDRLILRFREGGELRYRNMRKLGGLWLAHDRDEVDALLRPLGPDALTVSRAAFLERLARRRGSVKAALMDQGLVAGVGNILADEILWQARLHPLRPVPDLSDRERDTLARTLRSVLRESVRRYDYIERKRSWLAPVRGRRDARCPRCATTLARTVVGGRTTWFCPRCQT
jgi:formamidopyrimidine-DNA glycosylase